jgi:hypothetical protein
MEPARIPPGSQQAARFRGRLQLHLSGGCGGSFPRAPKEELSDASRRSRSIIRLRLGTLAGEMCSSRRPQLLEELECPVLAGGGTQGQSGAMHCRRGRSPFARPPRRPGPARSPSDQCSGGPAGICGGDNRCQGRSAPWQRCGRGRGNCRHGFGEWGIERRIFAKPLILLV